MINNTLLPSDQFDSNDVLLNETFRTKIIDNLTDHGWVLIRDFNIDEQRFSHLIGSLCQKLTFDPARNNIDDNTQKVDAGVDEIGLHIENGNTPFPPDIIAFFSKKSASKGSQTTVCDGHKLLNALPRKFKNKFSQKITVSRTLPEALWKQYVVKEHPDISNIEQVDAAHINQILSLVDNHRGELNSDGSLYYELDIEPLLTSKYSNVKSFANAILGPSFNYQPPKYTFADGTVIDQQMKHDLAEMAEKLTQQIDWQDCDVAIIDNQRVMHGRRAIEDPLNREIYIGMGMS